MMPASLTILVQARYQREDALLFDRLLLQNHQKDVSVNIFSLLLHELYDKTKFG